MLQNTCTKIRDSVFFEKFIIGVIILAGIVVGIETSDAIVETHHTLLHFIDTVILWIFVGEILIKIGAEGKKPWRFFGSAWNLFDFAIVAVCFLPFGGPWVAVVRLARILRALRLITAVPKLQILVGALLRSIPSMMYVSILLGLHFYIYAVMGTMFFKNNDPGHFGNLGLSCLTLFRVVTLEDWTDVMYTAIYGSHVYPAQGAIPVGPEPQAFGILAAIFFVTFVIIGAMVMINLFIGVILTSITEAQAEQLKEKMHLEAEHHQDKEILQGIERLEEEINSLKRAISQKRK